MLDMNCNPKDNANESAPQSASSSVAKIIISVDMSLTINCDDLKQLPEGVNQKTTVGL